MTNDCFEFDWPSEKRRAQAEKLERLLREAFDERTRNLRRQLEIAEQRLANTEAFYGAWKEFSAATEAFVSANSPEEHQLATERCSAAVQALKRLISDQVEI